MTDTPSSALPTLGPDDPAPVRIVNPHGSAPVLLLCDHASNAIPAALHGLGLTERDLHRHIAWDIGAAEVTEALATRLDAPAVLSGYSRLVVDTNRRLEHPESIARVSDGTTIPGNAGVTPEEALRRAEACFWPYHRRIGAGLAGFAERGIRPVIISMHGFTPVLAGVERPWHIGVLWDEDGRIALPLIESLRTNTDLVIGDNEPYSGRLRYGYSIEVHATEVGLANVLIEMREDQVAGREEQERTADLLAHLLAPILEDPALYRSGGD